MLITTHGLVGACIGKEVGYPPLAFLLGLISHFILDSIPHCDGPDDKAGRGENEPNSFAQYAFVAADIIIGVFIVVYLSSNNLASAGLIWGIIGAELPDVIDNVPFWIGIRKVPGFKQFHAFHAKIQSIKIPLWLGMLSQYSIAAIFLWLILR